MRTHRTRDHAYALAALLLTFTGAMLGVVALASALPPHTAAGAVLHAAGVQARALGPQAAATPSHRGARLALPPTPPPPPPPPPLVYAAPGSLPNIPVGAMGGGVLVDLDRQQLLWQTQPHTARATASLGKIFTVMVAMDHARLDQWVTVPPGGEDDNPNDSVMGLHVGDRVTVRQLVEGIWLASGDDAAETLARDFIPRDQFIAEMNAKAAMLGLGSTHLDNPSGLDAAGQYSTPYDLAVATGWLEIHYPAAFQLAAQSYIPLPANGLHGEDLTLRTVNKMVDNYNDTGHGYPGITGLKTGYTDNAGGCVVITATRGGRHLVAVVMNDPWFFKDAAAMLDYGFSH